MCVSSPLPVRTLVILDEGPPSQPDLNLSAPAETTFPDKRTFIGTWGGGPNASPEKAQLSSCQGAARSVAGTRQRRGQTSVQGEIGEVRVQGQVV